MVEGFYKFKMVILLGQERTFFPLSIDDSNIMAIIPDKLRDTEHQIQLIFGCKTGFHVFSSMNIGEKFYPRYFFKIFLF